MDVSVNKPFKVAIEQLATDDMKDNLDDYVNGKINASARRVLFTKWVGQAWEQISSDENMVIRSFRKVGIGLAADGSEGNEIHIEGLPGYQVDDSNDKESEEDSGESDDEDPFGDEETS